ncbi:alpha-defensin 1-like [Orycteropus afer afer]|uniref:Alpha-defensin 1-like n=1 Tax=Orycteropus afer afer TaxID=1230840 RepID=A0AC54ZFQ9_ORYAF|nr:alpha-defensin 1-like [Orycteropus afer afer]
MRLVTTAMRTLTLLAAILLLALQVQAEPLRQTDDEIPAQDEPGAEDQDIAISYAGDKRSAPDAPGLMIRTTCYCRRFFCRLGERRSGTCLLKGILHKLCCR